MLRITLHDTPDCLSFQLEGRLVGPWVAELEQCWRTAASIRDERTALIDLKDVTFIDDAGKDLLSRLRDERVTFAVRDAMTRAIVEEVTSGRLLNPDPRERIQIAGAPATSAHSVDPTAGTAILRADRE